MRFTTFDGTTEELDRLDAMDLAGHQPAPPTDTGLVQYEIVQRATLANLVDALNAALREMWSAGQHNFTPVVYAPNAEQHLDGWTAVIAFHLVKEDA